jgi:hypothetical protein
MSEHIEGLGGHCEDGFRGASDLSDANKQGEEFV